jgi:mono/diheme cytochrome c family protein
MVVMSIEVPEQARQRVVLPEVNAEGMLAGAPESDDPAARGEQLYTQNCAGCHGTRGEGGAAPTLIGSTAPQEVDAIAAVIKDPPPPMPDLHPSPLDDSGVAAVAEYVRRLQAADR